MSEHRNAPVPETDDDLPGDDFWVARDTAFAAEDARAMDELPEALEDRLGEESARRQWLKDAALTGELELPGLEDVAPLPEDTIELG